MPFDISTFSLSDTIRCGAELRKVIDGMPSVEDAAQAIVSYLYESLADPETGAPSAALVRCYKTHSFNDLPPDLQGFARNVLKRKPSKPDVKCLTLLGTAGSRPEWNSRMRSIGHQAIPLETVQMVEQAPMVAQLIRQLGIDVQAVIAPSTEILRQDAGKAYGVFYVEKAPGSPYIPAQDFVARDRIQSVVGFGGLLRNGDMIAIIIFSRTLIPVETANRFRTLALDVRAGIYAAGNIPTFRGLVE